MSSLTVPKQGKRLVGFGYRRQGVYGLWTTTDHSSLERVASGNHDAAMFQHDEEYQQRIFKSVVAAIARASAVDIGGGKQGCVMQPLDIAAVLTRLAADFMAADANNEERVSKRELRRYGEEFGKVLAKRMAEVIESGHALPAFKQIAAIPDPTLN